VLSKVRGQDEAVAYLSRVVSGQLTSPLLLVGGEGVGRRFSALEAIKDVFSGGDPESNFCLQVDRRLHPDLTLVSSDGGRDIGIEAIREVIRTAYDCPMFSDRKFYVLDGADRLTIPAANALLKTLEEPPGRTQFILLAESSEQVIPTIRSRCGTVRYKGLSEEFIAESLREFIPDPLIALVYARLSNRSLGRALRFFGANQLNLRNKAFNLIRVGIERDLSLLFSSVDDLKKESDTKDTFESDIRLALHFLEHILYDMILLPYNPSGIANLDLKEDLGLLGRRLGPARIRVLLQAINRVQHTASISKIQLVFHVKAALGTAFSE